MTASSETFSRKLAGFAAFLRKQGMRVGLSEVADMARALNETGFEDRETVRIAMKMLCAKSPREQEAFDQCFDAYFRKTRRPSARRSGFTRKSAARRTRSCNSTESQSTCATI